MIVLDNTYDIRTPESAYNTLKNITGITPDIWAEYVCKDYKYKNITDMISDILEHHMHRKIRYDNFDFIFSHITTSANECNSFKKYGILNLQDSYMCYESELRDFLNNADIFIDINNGILTYKDRQFDISYGDKPFTNSTERLCWYIGYKFYHDQAICGFLNIDDNPYLGQVHRRPEILFNIDNLLNTNLSYQWQKTHFPYEIVVKIHGDKTRYNYEQTDTEDEKVINMLEIAFNAAFHTVIDQYIILNDEVTVPPSNIIEINPFTKWR